MEKNGEGQKSLLKDPIKPTFFFLLFHEKKEICVFFFTAMKQHQRWFCFSVSEMKVWLGAAIIFFVCMILLLRFELLEGSFIESYIGLIANKEDKKPSLSPYNGGPLHVGVENNVILNEPIKRVGMVKEPSVIKIALSMVNSSVEESTILSIWQYMKPILSRSDNFPELKQALKEAKNNWIEFGKTRSNKNHQSVTNKTTEKQCPYSVSSINHTLSKGLKGIYEELEIPCGLVVDSAITIVAIPWGAEGIFAIELLGPNLPGELHPPVILHYNVRLLGDKVTNDAVIVQNTWSRERDWGDEERCPIPDANPKKGASLLDLMKHVYPIKCYILIASCNKACMSK